jgi:hypothetical protein
MPAGACQAFAIVRVARGAEPPSAGQLHEALRRDREHLRQGAPACEDDLQVAGPYRIVVDGVELDEYVAWAR